MTVAKKKVSANKAGTKRKAPPHAWKPGQSGNPAGRPKDGESWASVIKTIGDMYPEDILKFVGRANDLGKTIAQLPKNVQMKYLVTARVYAALMFEPTSGLWNGLMDRAEGKVKEELDVNLNNLTDEQRSSAIVAILETARARKAGQVVDDEPATLPSGSVSAVSPS